MMQFESSDNPEGSQTRLFQLGTIRRFESSDNPEGSQTENLSVNQYMGLRVVIIQRGLKLAIGINGADGV